MMWRIYYEDGSTFSDMDGSPWDAPRLGVQAIVAKDGQGYAMLSQADYYYWESARSPLGWWHCNPTGMTLHLQRAPRPLILFGSMIRTDQFTAIEKQALADMGALKRSWRRAMDRQDSGEVTRA